MGTHKQIDLGRLKTISFVLSRFRMNLLRSCERYDFNMKLLKAEMRGKPTKGRRRIKMLYDLAHDGGYVALTWAAEDREGWRHRERMSKSCCMYSRR